MLLSTSSWIRGDESESGRECTSYRLPATTYRLPATSSRLAIVVLVRVRVAVCVGMMTTWRDYLLNKCHTHTWMIYIPGLPLDLDYPEILALRAPLPSLVLNCNEDPLFTLNEMQRADSMLAETYRKAGAGDRYRASYYRGGHQFNLEMQAEAFGFFDRWLKPEARDS